MISGCLRGDDALKKVMAVMALAILAMCFAAPAFAQQTQMDKNIVQVATDAGSFKTLLAAAKAANLDGTLSTGGPYTVFAPTDDAFNKLPAGTVQSLSKDKPKLTAVLKNHVVSGKYTADDLVRMGTVKTLDGKTLKITKASDGSVMVDGVKVIKSNVMASNGEIQVIDSVLVPK